MCRIGGAAHERQFMDLDRLSAILISDFTVQPLADFLQNDGIFPALHASVGVPTENLVLLAVLELT